MITVKYRTWFLLSMIKLFRVVVKVPKYKEKLTVEDLLIDKGNWLLSNKKEDEFTKRQRKSSFDRKIIDL
jgi:predicted metal-dependent hydrolase